MVLVLCSKSRILFLANKNIPNLIPNPVDITIAGSSKIPWGKSENMALTKLTFSTFEKTNPNTAPFARILTIGKIPKKSPKRIIKKATVKLF